MVLSDLPDVLLSSLLSDWLTIVEAAHLDSAICNHANRNDFINVAYKSNTLLSYSNKIRGWCDCCDKMNKWIFRRGALVSGLYGTFFFATSHSERKEYLAIYGRSICWVDWCLNFSNDFHQCAADIVEHCPNLIRFRNIDVEESLLLRMAERCPLLEDFNAGGTELTPAGALVLWLRLRHLRKVALHYHPHSEESLLALVHNNPHIESLSLIGLGVTDYFYAELARSCTCLLDLSLAGAHAELQSLEILWQGCSTLRMLTFLQCNLYSHQPKTVCDSLRELVLNDSSIDDKTLRELLRVCPGLTVLQLTDCDELLRLHDLPLGELCPNLRTLKLVGNGSCAGEVLLRSVGAHCTELRELDIPAAPAAKDAGLCAIAGGCRHLHQLNLIDCVNVANKTLLAVAAYCAELEILTLRGCKKVTDKGVKAVMKGCPKLVEFSVAHCYRLSTKVEIAVSERYENDDYLHAWSC